MSNIYRNTKAVNNRRENVKKLSKQNTDGTQIGVRWIIKTGEALRHIITSWASMLLHDSHLNLSLR